MELANFLSQGANRAVFLSLFEDLRTDPRVLIVPSTPELFERGVELYALRLDKNWSLTDCISFTVMERQGLTDSATTDHHFAQAGFAVLLKEA